MAAPNPADFVLPPHTRAQITQGQYGGLCFIVEDKKWGEIQRPSEQRHLTVCKDRFKRISCKMGFVCFCEPLEDDVSAADAGAAASADYEGPIAVKCQEKVFLINKCLDFIINVHIGRS